MGYQYTDPRVAALLRDRVAMPETGADLVANRDKADPYAGTADALPTADTLLGQAAQDLILMSPAGDRMAQSRTARALLGSRSGAGAGGETGGGEGLDPALDAQILAETDPYKRQLLIQERAARAASKLAAEDRTRKHAVDAFAHARDRLLAARADKEYEDGAALRAAKATNDLLAARVASGETRGKLGLDAEDLTDPVAFAAGSRANRARIEADAAAEQKREDEAAERAFEIQKREKVIAKYQAEIEELKAEAEKHKRWVPSSGGATDYLGGTGGADALDESIATFK